MGLDHRVNVERMRQVEDVSVSVRHSVVTSVTHLGHGHSSLIFLFHDSHNIDTHLVSWGQVDDMNPKECVVIAMEILKVTVLFPFLFIISYSQRAL